MGLFVFRILEFFDDSTVESDTYYDYYENKVTHQYIEKKRV